MISPSWVPDATFYQIFPDRFYNGDPSNDPPNVQPWGAPPTYAGYQGGDLRGIIQKLDYLLELGINALYINPIFAGTSNHRYDTRDYYKIDPALGTLDDFRSLIDTAHKKNIRIILDGVFNHCGREFFAFQDVLEYGPDSQYKDWFHIYSFPLDAFGEGKSTTYAAWWDIKDLPKFNTGNPETRKYLIDVARYWVEQGIDGWRLDVPNEIDDDSFWSEFRQAVKAVNPETYIVGEIWELGPRWVGENHFDGLMHYSWRGAVTDVLTGKIPAAEFARRTESFLPIYPPEYIHSMYLPLSSHDTKRILTKVNGDMDKVRLAYLLQFANLGAPSIYYGDEIGMEGGKDPDNRRAFPWDEKQWNTDLQTYIKSLIALRKKHPALRRGDLQRVYFSDELSVYSFSRSLDEEKILIAVNPNNEPRTLRIPVASLGWEDGQVFHDLLSNKQYSVTQESLELTLTPWSGVMVSL